MIDLLAEKRARMACRAYLKLFDAGSGGANLTKDDMIGPRDAHDTDWAIAVELLGHFVDDTIVDEAGHRDGVPHYVLTRPMRERMEGAPEGRGSVAERLRADLADYDSGRDLPEDAFHRTEALIRTGDERREPL